MIEIASVRAELDRPAGAGSMVVPVMMLRAEHWVTAYR
jgi:hypothetical protein